MLNSLTRPQVASGPPDHDTSEQSYPQPLTLWVDQFQNVTQSWVSYQLRYDASTQRYLKTGLQEPTATY